MAAGGAPRRSGASVAPTVSQLIATALAELEPKASRKAFSTRAVANASARRWRSKTRYALSSPSRRGCPPPEFGRFWSRSGIKYVAGAI